MSRFFRDKLPHKAAQPPWRVKHAYLPRGAGWSHAVAVRMDVMSGRPVASVFAEKGEKKSIVITLLTLEGFFMFFIHDAPQIVELGELTRMVMERRVPFGLFTALLREESEFFPVYNWLRRLLRTGSFTLRFTIVRPIAILEKTAIGQGMYMFEDVVELDEMEKSIFAKMVEILDKEYADRLVGFEEVGESSLRLHMLGPTRARNGA